jgi:hypothetical protein
LLSCHTQALRDDKDAVEAEIANLAAAAAKDLGLILDKTIKLEWHKVNVKLHPQALSHVSCCIQQTYVEIINRS